MPRHPKIYKATEQAAGECPFILLDGTVEAAQSFVDAITTSVWWSEYCKPLFHGEVPTSVLLTPTDLPGFGAGLLNDDEDDEKQRRDGRHVPGILVGMDPSHGTTPPMADAWVLLHELAHVWEFESWHDKPFLYAFAALVKRFLGINHHAALVQAMRDQKIRLNYRSILNGSNPVPAGTRSLSR